MEEKEHKHKTEGHSERRGSGCCRANKSSAFLPRCPRCLTAIISFELHNNPLKEVLYLSFTDGGSESVTCLGCYQAIQIQELRFATGSLQLRHLCTRSYYRRQLGRRTQGRGVSRTRQESKCQVQRLPLFLFLWTPSP